MRLPGIESFVEMTRLAAPPRNPSPMMIDSEVPRPPPLSHGGEPGVDDQRGVGHGSQWDINLHRGLNRLDISTPPRDSAGAWANEANQALLARAEQARVRFEPEVKTMPPAPAPMPPTNAPSLLGPRHQHTVSAPSFNTPRESRRHGWYNGPIANFSAAETIHEGRTHVNRIEHPNLNSFQGFPAREHQPVIHQPVIHQQQPGPTIERVDRIERMERIPERPPPNQDGSPESLKRLEALVAVATGQGPVATY